MLTFMPSFNQKLIGFSQERPKQKMTRTYKVKSEDANFGSYNFYLNKYLKIV